MQQQNEVHNKTRFQISLDNFKGPFDLLLTLIHSKKLEVTEVALATVTDEFIEYTQQLGKSADLDEMTEFLVVAATLLDIKSAYLIPNDDAPDEKLELLENRDLLFARLLQYKAYSQVADIFSQWEEQAQRRYPRLVGMEEEFAALLPPVELGHNAHTFAELAAGVFRPKPPETISTEHVHSSEVSVPEQAGKVLSTLEAAGEGSWLSFGALTQDCEVSLQVVGRFLALLELYKARAITLKQQEQLAELSVAWTGIDVDPTVIASTDWS